MKTRYMIKTMAFVEDRRGDIDLAPDGSDGLRLVPGENLLELPSVDGSYETGGEHYAVTWLVNPTSCQGWHIFQSRSSQARDPDGGGAVVTSITYRLTDGTDHYWWDGSEWATTNTEWNTEAVVSTNIDDFDFSSRKIGFVIRMETSDPRVSPRLAQLRVGYWSNVKQWDSILNRSLIVAMRDGMRPIGRTQQAHGGGETFTFNAESLRGAYELADDAIDSIFDIANDPDEVNDLFQSYDSQTGEVTMSQDPGEVELRVYYIYIPEIIWTKSSFVEVRKVPQLVIVDPSLVNDRVILEGEKIVDYESNEGYMLTRIRQGNLDFGLTIAAGSNWDYTAMSDALHAFFADNQNIHHKALDERYDLVLSASVASSQFSNGNDERNGEARAMLVNTLFYEGPAKRIYGVKAIQVTGPPNFTAG